MVNYKDYIQVQIDKDMKCSCCDYTVIAKSNAWISEFSKTDELLCTPCWDKKRHGQECGEREGHAK